ncbi:Cytochrome P450 76A1 [Hibiscus syriacus]|uniref:Cytochrome P450 76A1 n=1 Tax=Hibiscus syriacus TaxID=106335 RepID=A0A6A2ZEM1_HIBSY|nr:iridoid oxidase-like [Hibiscus syriacus]KAE8690056.1 Cytochrome P450 76A1 [Hibiscus syriacus]
MAKTVSESSKSATTRTPRMANIRQLFRPGNFASPDPIKPKYGPVLGLKLGSVNTVVIQSAVAASELFKNHDHDFCDRKCPIVLTAHNYCQGTLAFGRYDKSWSKFRRICSMGLSANRQTNEMARLRQKCIDDMVRYIQEDAAAAARERGEEGKVNLAHFLFLMSFNLVGNLVLSRDLLSSRSEEGKQFFDAMNEVMVWAGKPNLADFLPVLKWLDPQGIKRNMVRYMGRAMKIVSSFVNERIDDLKLAKEKTTKDFLDTLLEHTGEGKQGPATISNHNVIIIILEMFFAGSETTSSTIEWAMAELLRNPESMAKAKQELNRVIGAERKVDESDTDNLPYLQAVIKETLRLHSALPLLLPRNAMQETKYMGYFIPKGTQIFVNAWAIGRDPESWEDPLAFKPERFLGSNIEYKEQNFELIPFGSGRRICVGMPVAHKVVHLALASLLHSFDWELGNNLCPETIDMNERVGITARKLIPVEAIPKKRLCIHDHA